MSNYEKQVFENFKFFVLQNNTTTGLGTPGLLLTQFVETKLATITIPADCDDSVWLSGTVGWLNNNAAGGTNATLTIKIHRDNEITGPVIFEAKDSNTATFNTTTSFSHVDYNFPRTSDCVTYILTVTANVANVYITGPVTFIAAEIENKRHHEEKKCEDKCENKCEREEHKCEPKCEQKCEPKCKPHHKSYYQSYDFD